MKVHGSECDVLIQLVARVLYMYVRIYVDRWHEKTEHRRRARAWSSVYSSIHFGDVIYLTQVKTNCVIRRHQTRKTFKFCSTTTLASMSQDIQSSLPWSSLHNDRQTRHALEYYFAIRFSLMFIQWRWQDFKKKRHLKRGPQKFVGWLH